jgi:phage/plasmid-associated DNA primase
LNSDLIGDYLDDILVSADGNRLKTSQIYDKYEVWAKDNGYRPVNNKIFMAELLKKYDVRRNGKHGHQVLGMDFA